MELESRIGEKYSADLDDFSRIKGVRNCQKYRYLDGIEGIFQIDAGNLYRVLHKNKT